MVSTLMEFISSFEIHQNNSIVDFWIWDLMSILYDEGMFIYACYTFIYEIIIIMYNHHYCVLYII